MPAALHLLRAALPLCVACSITASSAAITRNWVHKSYPDGFRAELEKVENGRVYLKRESDGRTISLNIDGLSAYDQRWVERYLQRKDKPTGSSTRPATGSTPAAGGGPAPGQFDWPQWRGPNRDGKSAETGLLSSWPPQGPPKRWSANGLGKGYASVAVAGGRVYTAGNRGGTEYLICLDDSVGKQLWVCPIGRGDHCNGTPTVDDGLVFAIGLDGDVLCADAQTGREVWRKNFQRDFGGKMMSQWGFSESPLVDGSGVILTPGGQRAMLVALNKRTGETFWATQFPDVQGQGKDGAGYSSVVVSNAGGVRQYVQNVGRGAIGVEARTGKLLWGYNKIANDTANIPTPIVWDDYVFVSNGYNAGAALLRLAAGAGGIKAREIYFLPANQMQVHHGGMILHEGHVYCGHGQSQGYPLCLNVASGKVAWGPERGAGTGSAAITYADGHLYMRYENGTMALVEANPNAYRLKGQFRIATVHDKSWPHPAIANGKLYLRDQDDLHCYALRP